MGIQIQYEPAPQSEAMTNEERHQFAVEFYEWRKQDDPEFDDPPPDPNIQTMWARGVFTIQVDDLDRLLGLLERDVVRLQVGPVVMRLRPHWHPEWPDPGEFYERIRGRLRVLRSPEEFDWSLFEPVYPLIGWGVDIRHLVAWLLENGRAAAWCKACQRGYQVSELAIYNWSWTSEMEGSQYVCPEDHVLLETYHMFLGALSSSPFQRERRELRPGV